MRRYPRRIRGQSLVGRMVEVYAVIRMQHHAAFVSDAEYIAELRIQKHLAVSGEFHF
ncbi:MAG: hypothetical protein JO336_06715 [Acidobacteriia bacterium]|nr:hypothetical protein [Terriglobia bacterium]MBV9746084.1 hypothetical protein [Terriglobia bacterium]